MIKTFRGEWAQAIFKDRKVPKGMPSDLAKVARRKLIQIHSAVFLDDLKVPPGNRLEGLKGNLRGKHSIRINDQWRIVFRWTGNGAEEVEIADYH